MQGLLPKEAVRAQYDGSLFYQLARKTEARRAAVKRDTSKVPRALLVTTGAIILIGVLASCMLLKYGNHVEVTS